MQEPDPAVTPIDPALPVKVGQVLAERFEVRGAIGSGGHGHVLLAEHLPLRYPVAVKLLDPSMAMSEAHRERFRREAILGAAVKSANVARVLEAGETPDGHPFLVMELVDGPSLRDVLERGPLPIEAAVDLGIQLASALVAFDAQQLVHRDVKPSNVVLQWEPDGRVVAKLVDLGVTRVSSAEARAERVSDADMVVGTPLYMAPEQVEGAAHDIRSDLYSLSVLLYEALTGRPPHAGVTPAAVLGKALHGERPDLRALRGEVPETLAKVVDKGLSVEVSDRWQSPLELAEALERVCAEHRMARAASAWEELPARQSWENTEATDTPLGLLDGDVDPFETHGTVVRRRVTRWVVLAGLLVVCALSVASLFVE